MGWSVSHGANQNGPLYRSYTQMSNLGEQIANVLTWRDWRKVKHLFNPRSGDPFTVPAKEAGQIAPILRKAASHPRMPADWAADTNLLADTAHRAATTGQNWEWR